MSAPLSYYDHFTKQDIANNLLEISPQTLTNRIKKGLLFEPYSNSKNYSNSANPRKYYNLADAMKLSIMTYGTIKMDRIYKLLCYEDQLSPYLKRIRKEQISQSLVVVKSDIVNKSVDPVDLTPYLEQETPNATA